MIKTACRLNLNRIGIRYRQNRLGVGMEEKKPAIEVNHVKKIYKLYNRNSDRIKEAFGFRKKANYKLHYALNDVNIKIWQGRQ